MKKSITLFFLLLSFSILSYAQNVDDKFTLIFEENFDYEGEPNSQYWSYSERWHPDWARYLTKNNPETVLVTDGILRLRTIKNTDRSKDNVPYLTGGIETVNKVDFLYGKVEVRAKLPMGQGSWPAIWLMPTVATYGGWPDSGEIDIMEHLNHDRIIYQTIHSKYKYDTGENTGTTTGFDVNKFNVFGVEWFPDRIDFFVNGNKTHTYSRRVPDVKWQWPFDHKYYLILNSSCGGDDKQTWAGRIEESDLPFTMEVDWVKIYELKEDRPYDIPSWAGNFEYNDPKLKDTYVESITSTGLKEDIAYETSERPSEYYNLFDKTLEVEENTKFSLNLKSYSLGSYSTSVVKQDMRYTVAYAYVDYDGDKHFETNLTPVGKVAPNIDNIGGNIETLDANFDFKSPKIKNDSQNGRIRIVYHNAWSHHKNANAPLIEGVVHDFDLKITKAKTSVASIEFNPVIKRMDNILLIKAIDESYTVSVFDITGKMISNKLNSAFQDLELAIPNNQFILIKLNTESGKQFVGKF